jgi:NADPH:quinone reductase-like Zn-dependent oxidoreductase
MIQDPFAAAQSSSCSRRDALIVAPSGYVRGLGADAIIDRKQQDMFARPAGSFDVIFDTTGLYGYGRFSRLLAPSGTFVATLPSPSTVLGMLTTIVSSKQCRIVSVRPRRTDLEQLGAWLAAGLAAPISARFPLDRAADALVALKQGGQPGKIVIEIA